MTVRQLDNQPIVSLKDKTSVQKNWFKPLQNLNADPQLPKDSLTIPWILDGPGHQETQA